MIWFCDCSHAEEDHYAHVTPRWWDDVSDVDKIAMIETMKCSVPECECTDFTPDDARYRDAIMANIPINRIHG